jgi:hypothetical protein
MTETHSLVRSYLERLDGALRDVPPARRKEIVSEIREHIGEATGGSAENASEAEVRTILDQLGDPETIAEDARDRFDVPERKGGALEGFALVLLLVGGFIGLGVGWIAGAVMLWVSKVWTTRDKVIGTLFVPGGLALTFFLGAFAMSASAEVCEISPGGTQVCSGGGASTSFLGYLLLAFLVVAPIVAAIYLGRHAFSRRSA